MTGVPCGHAVTAIQESRQSPIDFVAHWFKKETYMRTYSYCLEVIKGEEYWEDVEGDTILPPVIVKKLRGRPQKLRRREGWEGGSSGKKQKMTSKGSRKMHCGICRKEGHNRSKCPNKPDDYQPPQPRQKRRGNTNEEHEDEMNVEVQLQEQEAQTGEADLMDELMREVDARESELPKNKAKSAMMFVSVP